MRTAWHIALVGLLLALSAHRLPAPISEVPATPHPKPKREAVPKSRPKNEATSKPTPNLSFAGAWTGPAITVASDGSSSNNVYLIKVSDDEKTVWVNWAEVGQPLTGPVRQAPSNRFRGALTWSLSLPDYLATCTIQINPNGTAAFAQDGTWTGGDNQGVTFKSTGTLSRQDVSSPPSIPQTTPVSVPQKTTTSATSQTTGFPTASPVPNKPGFVYNPFEPIKKRILDVRGIPSGTKVTIPASGKQFIVP